MKFGKWLVYAKGKVSELPKEVTASWDLDFVPHDTELLVFATQGGFSWVRATDKAEEYAQ